jgi:hypothetical protein
MFILSPNLLIIYQAYAQVPTLSNVEILGPVDMYYYDRDMSPYYGMDMPFLGTGYNEITMISPIGESKNPVNITFSVSAEGWCGSFWDIGVSVDNGVIYRTTDFASKSVVSEFPGLSNSEEKDLTITTVIATAKIPFLSQGSHTATVYYGRQYLVNPSFEVYAKATITFFVAGSPPSPIPTQILITTPTPTQQTTQTAQSNQLINGSFSSLAMIVSGVIVFVVILGIALLIIYKKQTLKRKDKN